MKKPSDRLTLIAKDASDDQNLVRATAQIFSRPMDSLLAGVIATIDSLSAGDNTIVERTGGCNKGFPHPYPISSQSWGNKAAIVIISMTTSKGAEAPRGTEFLFNPNRFNVAVSRAECLAIVVHGTELLEGAWTKIDDLRRLNLFAHAEALALQTK